MSGSDGTTILVHASSVALNDRALVILGPSGSGKSTLALQLIAMGCRLIADDQTCLTLRAGRLWATAPATALGRIEARGIGILTADTQKVAPVAFAIDMGEEETGRLPPTRTIALAGHPVPCLLRVAGPHFAPGVFLALRSGHLG